MADTLTAPNPAAVHLGPLVYQRIIPTSHAVVHQGRQR
tara:strand:+ start:298 stop:411 length:114 start_codon:yes stop_codon:yes gene_type:complete